MLFYISNVHSENKAPRTQDSDYAQRNLCSECVQFFRCYNRVAKSQEHIEDGQVQAVYRFRCYNRVVKSQEQIEDGQVQAVYRFRCYNRVAKSQEHIEDGQVQAVYRFRCYNRVARSQEHIEDGQVQAVYRATTRQHLHSCGTHGGIELVHLPVSVLVWYVMSPVLEGC
jgi:hypothetical protein